MQQGSPLLELYLIENREHITKNCGQFEIKKINEIQSLFLGQYYFINGVVKYQMLIDILLGRFWDEKKNSLSEEIFFILTNEGRKVISLNDMKNTLDKIVEESNDKKFLMNSMNLESKY